MVFQAEFYRAVRQLIAGRVTPPPEFSDHRIELQRIDLRIPEVNWGVEILRDDDDLLEHYGRFTSGEKYTMPGLGDWMFFDFRVSIPCKAHSKSSSTPCEGMGGAHYAIESMPNLYHVVFDEGFLTGQILNNTLGKALLKFRLSP